MSDCCASAYPTPVPSDDGTIVPKRRKITLEELAPPVLRDPQFQSYFSFDLSHHTRPTSPITGTAGEQTSGEAPQLKESLERVGKWMSAKDTAGAGAGGSTTQGENLLQSGSLFASKLRNVLANPSQHGKFVSWSPCGTSVTVSHQEPGFADFAAEQFSHAVPAFLSQFELNNFATLKPAEAHSVLANRVNIPHSPSSPLLAFAHPSFTRTS